MLPDDVVCFLQRGILIRIDQILKFRHELGDLRLRSHPADAVILVRHDSKKLSSAFPVIRHRDGGMSRFLRDIEHVRQCHIRRHVGIAHHKSGPVTLHPSHHFHLLLNRLRAINKGQAAFLCQRDRKSVVGNRLHDRGYHRDVDGKLRLLSFFISDQRCFQTHLRRNTVRGRIPWNQKKFAESSGWFPIIKCHIFLLFEPSASQGPPKPPCPLPDSLVDNSIIAVEDGGVNRRKKEGDGAA